MKKLLIASLLLLFTASSIAGSFSTGVIDSTARANAATAQATANAAEPTASLPAYLASPPAIGSVAPNTGKFTTLQANTSQTLNGHLLMSSTVPTIGTGWGTGASLSCCYVNGTAAFIVVTGTSPGTSQYIGLPATPNGWICSATYANTGTYIRFVQAYSLMSTTGVTFNSYANSTMTLTAPVGGQYVYVQCTGT